MVTKPKEPTLDLRKLLSENPEDELLDLLADRIVAKLRNTPEKLVLTISEAATALSLSHNTVYELCQTGVLPATREYGNWRISLPALRKQLERVGE